MDEIEKQEIINNMDMLKRKFVNVNKNDIDKVKNLIRSYGATYYDAPGEADELCAMLTIKGKVWACLSEDMDLFVYGCTRVIRYLSLMNHTAVLYYMKGILDELNMNYNEFKEVINKYAFVFFDGPHDKESVLTEVVWFLTRIDTGTVFVFDDVASHDHNYIDGVLLKNGFERMETGSEGRKISYIKGSV